MPLYRIPLYTTVHVDINVDAADATEAMDTARELAHAMTVDTTTNATNYAAPVVVTVQRNWELDDELGILTPQDPEWNAAQGPTYRFDQPEWTVGPSGD